MKPNRNVIDSIADLLEKASSGEIQGFACITLEPDNGVGQCVAGSVKDDKFKAIAALDVLQRDIMDGVERLKNHYPKVFKETIRGGKAA